VTEISGVTQLLPDCLVKTGGNGTITIDVHSQCERARCDCNRLHEVTATRDAHEELPTRPSVAGIGGVLFNLIDVAQVTPFDPTKH